MQWVTHGLHTLHVHSLALQVLCRWKPCSCSTIRSCPHKCNCSPASSAVMRPWGNRTWQGTFARMQANTLLSVTCARLLFRRAANSRATSAATLESVPFRATTVVQRLRRNTTFLDTCAPTLESVLIPVFSAMCPSETKLASLGTWPLVM